MSDQVDQDMHDVSKKIMIIIIIRICMIAIINFFPPLLNSHDFLSLFFFFFFLFFIKNLSQMPIFIFSNEHEHATIRFLPLLPAKFTIFFNQIKSIETWHGRTYVRTLITRTYSCTSCWSELILIMSLVTRTCSAVLHLTRCSHFARRTFC